ncbi:MAG: PEP-CTERM sorting domain-containing protein [Candidatus Aureabacteria bacterium]|nr:PEP-CTERM sorting domain-containing protein [Candidatus Auribacterota bacterium]
MGKAYIFGLLLGAAIVMASGPAQADLVNLFNYNGGEYPSFNWIWNQVGTNHSVEIWNDGSTAENFLNSRLVLNVVLLLDGTQLNWDTTNKCFSDGTRTVSLSSYDGEFDNTSGLIPNMRTGIWPYFNMGDLLAGGAHSAKNFDATGSFYLYLESDTIADVQPVPEPASLLLLGAGLIALLFLRKN